MLGYAEAELIREHRIKAKAEGRAEGRAELVLHAMEHRFDAVPDAVRRRVLAASYAEHEEWLHAMVDGKTLDEIFREGGPA